MIADPKVIARAVRRPRASETAAGAGGRGGCAPSSGGDAGRFTLRARSREGIFHLRLVRARAPPLLGFDVLLHDRDEVYHVGLEGRTGDACSPQDLLCVPGVIAHRGRELLDKRARAPGEALDTGRAEQGLCDVRRDMA